jgi:hypothetical protein
MGGRKERRIQQTIFMRMRKATLSQAISMVGDLSGVIPKYISYILALLVIISFGIFCAPGGWWDGDKFGESQLSDENELVTVASSKGENRNCFACFRIYSNSVNCEGREKKKGWDVQQKLTCIQTMGKGKEERRGWEEAVLPSVASRMGPSGRRKVEKRVEDETGQIQWHW